MPELLRVRQPSSRQLLSRVLDQPDLVTAIQGLAPRALGALVDAVGLEDAGELIALATTEQLVHVFDEDLWRADRPGQDERFDAARFVVWLEVLLEAGAAFAARRFAELPEELVVHALFQRVLVLDLDALAVELAEAGDDAEPIEKALDGCAYHELDEYRVIARGPDGWDALVTLLTELDAHHHASSVRILERLAHLTSREVDDGGGLYDVLTSDEMLAADVAGAREDRRAEAGYLAPSQAVAFLKLAAATEPAAARGQGRDPITRAYFRELAPTQKLSAPATARPAPAERLTALLADHGALAEAAPARDRLGDGDGGPHPLPGAGFRDAVRALADRDPVRHAQRLAELAFLANVLVAGAAAGERGFRPAEAAQGAVAACELGLAHLVAGGEDAAAIVAREGAEVLFRLGWRLLHERTGDPARALLAAR